MGWANYYRARLPDGASARDALAAARRIVATCARPPIDLDARWTVSRSSALVALAERLRGIEAAAERRVDVELLPADPQAVLEILGSCPHEVELAVRGPEPSQAPSLTVNLERVGGAAEFGVSVEIRVEGGLTRASDEVRRAIVDRLAECQRSGALPVAAAPERIVEQFVAAARREGAVRALAQGVEEDGYRLVCRAWRSGDPAVLTVVSARPIVPEAARLVPLWSEPPLYFGGWLRGRESVATAARMSGLAGGVAGVDLGAFFELVVEVRGEAELDALVDVAGDDPVVAQWWCGFDGWGSAYHGVRLALNGRYQDGSVGPEPGRHEVIVLVDAKRRDPGAHEVAAGLAARCGLALAYARTGL